MKTLLFDPLSGASGNMILGSLIDLGADVEKIREAVESVADVALSVERTRGRVAEAANVKIQPFHEITERNYQELVEFIQNSRLPGITKKDVLTVFRIMATAEAKIQGLSIEHLPFKGGEQDRVLAELAGCCTALRDLCPEAVLATPVNIGRDIAPATLEILRTGGLLFYGRGEGKLLTPAGAALIAHFARPVDNIPLGRVLAIAYGTDGYDTETSGILRALLIEIEDDMSEGLVEVLETNVDNVSGEILGNLFDRLLALGARDVTISPVTMKKGRPGHLIRVISLPHTSAALAREIMRETGTLGIRVMTGLHRFTAARRIDSVTFFIGEDRFEVPVKIASDQSGEIFHISAEHEVCRNIADSARLPLREVMRRAEEEAWKRFGTPSH
ncbi:MAG: nickel pincer cofactor biosynthesis protein LarC [Thermovirgaceae bacterium]|nr:nickel pincer cofactor biosynthesis protein LarC [Thermovirgaceae bacterium]